MSFCNQLSLINPAVSLIFAGCFLVVWRQLRSQHLLAFGVSFALYAVAVAIQVLSPPSDAVWTTLVAAPFYIGSTMLIACGLRADCRRSRRGWLADCRARAARPRARRPVRSSLPCFVLCADAEAHA